MNSMGAAEWLLILHWVTGALSLFFLCGVFIPPIGYWLGSVYTARAMAQEAGAAEFERVRTAMRQSGNPAGKAGEPAK